MKTSLARSSLFALLAIAFLASCEATGPQLLPPDPPPEEEEGGEEEETPEILQTPEIEAALAHGQRQPLEFIVQATEPQPARKTRTLDEARTAIEGDRKLEPLREALAEGGWDEEERAQMVYFAGTHMSGAPEDSIRHRQQQIHDQVSADLSKFRQELARAEAEQGIRIDREDLFKAGVMTTLSTEVIR